MNDRPTRQRSRLAVLVTSALLTTSIGSFSSSEATTTPGSRGNPALPAVSAAPPDLDRPTLRSEPDSSVGVARSDATTHRDILQRLSIRHTGLPKRERIALAQTIIREARRQNLDPDLVMAVIEVESAGYHLAVSRVGAMGLMQLLPSTGKELAGKLDIEWMGEDTLFDPAINVKLGTAYLRELADRYDSVDVALAAYNWGPGRIDRRLRRGSAVPSKYIEQVMRAYGRESTLASRRS
jgi:hypothetical protein